MFVKNSVSFLMLKAEIILQLIQILYSRLQDFLNKHNVMKLCGENAGYGGNCITDHDIVNLWRLYLEVRPDYEHCMSPHSIVNLYPQGLHLGSFQRVLPSSNYFKYFRHSPTFSDKILSLWLKYIQEEYIS